MNSLEISMKNKNQFICFLFGFQRRLSENLGSALVIQRVIALMCKQVKQELLSDEPVNIKSNSSPWSL